MYQLEINENSIKTSILPISLLSSLFFLHSFFLYNKRGFIIYQSISDSAKCSILAIITSFDTIIECRTYHSRVLRRMNYIYTHRIYIQGQRVICILFYNVRLDLFCHNYNGFLIRIVKRINFCYVELNF